VLVEKPTHPMDEELSRRQWKRAQLSDLSESCELAGRLACRALTAPGTRQTLALVDVHLWLQGDNVRFELATQHVPPFLELFVAQGLFGVAPQAVGLVPCEHEPWHWNPFCLPLIWQQGMNSLPDINAFMHDYVHKLEDSSWQCPDAARFMW